MTDEKDFYRELAEVPELPAEVYPLIERRVRRRSVVRNSLYVITASFILFIGTVTLLTNKPSRTVDVQPEVATELQIIHDYLNSSDLEGDLDLYAVVEGY